MSGRLLNVMLPGSLDSGTQTIVDVTDDTGGHTHDERAGRDAHPLRHDRSRGDHTPRAHMHVIKKDRAHPDETVVLHGAGVQDDPVRSEERRVGKEGKYVRWAC